MLLKPQVPKFAPLRVRLLSRAIINFETGCWEWAGPCNRSGYGRISAKGFNGFSSSAFVHRVAYEMFVGPIPDGLTIDHLCRNHGCLNPAHLEAVTQRENNHRSPYHAARIAQTHCVNGHEFTPENTRITSKGHRSCRICNAETVRAYWAANPEKRRASRQKESERKRAKRAEKGGDFR